MRPLFSLFIFSTKFRLPTATASYHREFRTDNLIGFIRSLLSYSILFGARERSKRVSSWPGPARRTGRIRTAAPHGSSRPSGAAGPRSSRGSSRDRRRVSRSGGQRFIVSHKDARGDGDHWKK